MFSGVCRRFALLFTQASKNFSQHTQAREMKTAKEYLDAANAAVPRISAEEAISQHGKGVFVDVRDLSLIHI